MKLDGKMFHKQGFGDRDDYVIESVLNNHRKRAYKKMAGELDDNTKDIICELLLKDPIKNNKWRYLIL